MRRVVSAAPNAAVVATTGCSSVVVTSAGLSFRSPSPLGTVSNSGFIATMLSQPSQASPSVAATRSALSMASFSTVTPARLQRSSRRSGGASIDPLFDKEGGDEYFSRGGGGGRSAAYNNNTSMNARNTEAVIGGERQMQRGARGVDNNDRVGRLSSSQSATSPRKSSLPPPPARFKKLIDQHHREESARFVKREQYTRIYEFLKGLRRSTTAADTWQASVAALKDAASRGTPMTSDLVAEAIESCYAAKQYETANELFYSFHFNFNLARGPKASLAFLRVCAATGQFEAASRVIEWIGGGGLDAATDSQDTSSSRPLLSEQEGEMNTSSSVPTAASSSPSDDGHVEDALGGGGASVDDGSNENLKLETLWMQQEELKSAAATEKKGASSGNVASTQSAARTPYSSSLSSSFALTAEMMTLFLRSAATVANTDKDLYLHHVYPRALHTYQRLRLSHRNARTIVTNPLLVEALVQLHAKAQRWEPAYVLLLKTVRLLAVDSSRSGGGGGGGDGSFSSLSFGEEGVTPQARRLRKLVSCDADEEVVADGAARDARALFSQTNTSSSHGHHNAEEEHDALLSDGSLRGNIKMSESALDEILVRFGVKRSETETHKKKDKAEGEEEDSDKDWSVTVNEKSSLDDLLAEAEEAEMLVEGMRRGGLGGKNDADRQKEAIVRLQQDLKEMSAEVRSFSEVERSSGGGGKGDSSVASLNTSDSKSNMNTSYTGPLPSNITYITQGTFDAVIRVCFSAKKFLQTFKTAQLAISLGPAASDNYAPDEASARMLIFSIEEVTAAIYQTVGGNVPALQMQREYLNFCAKERARIRQKLVDEKTAARDASYGALKKQGLLLTATSSSSSKLAGVTKRERDGCFSEDVLPPVTVSEVELLMALPEEVVSSSTDLLTRLNAWKLSKQLFYGLADKGFPLFPQTYESPFRTFIAAGEIESAAEMINEMRKDGRVVPSYCYERLVCERIAHEPVSKRAEGMFEKTLKTLTDVRFSPAAYNSLLRHALAVDNPRLFKNTSRQMLNLEVVEDKEKLLLTIRSRMAANNTIGALAAFSRLNNILSHEARRTAKETDHKVYTSDFFLPQPLIRQLLEAADSYVSSQEKRKARVHQIGGGNDPDEESGGNADGAHHDKKFVPFSTLQDTKALPEYWNAERERNLEMAKVVQKALADRIESGFEGQYLGRDVKQIAAAAAEEKGRRDAARSGSSDNSNRSGQQSPSSAAPVRKQRSHQQHHDNDRRVGKGTASRSSSSQAGSAGSSVKEGLASASADEVRPSNLRKEDVEEEGVPLPPDKGAASSPSSSQSKKAKAPIASW